MNQTQALKAHGVYVGRRRHLYGKTALLRRKNSERLLAQFDSLKLPLHYTHNWKCFAVGQWRAVARSATSKLFTMMEDET